MKKIIILFLISVVSFFTVANTVSAAPAKSKHDADQYYPDFETDQDIKDARIKKNIFTKGVQFGGWINQTFMDERNSGAYLSTSMSTMKLFLKFYMWDNSYFYVRTKKSLMAVMDQSDLNIDQYKFFFDIDVAYMNMYWNRWYSIEFSFGRKFFSLGSGLVFNGRGDGLQLDFSAKSVHLKVMAAYIGYINFLNKELNPYGISDRDLSAGARRLFVGGSISYGFYNQNIYILALGQMDFGQESSIQKDHYQSQYYGLGFNGVILDGLTYFAEGVFETGVSYVNGTTDLRPIIAGAAQFGMKYYFDAKCNPVIIFNYAYGSGDKDRNDYRSPNGNTAGVDNGFIYFGTYVGGYSLRPLLANIHVLRWGVSFAPFEWSNNIFVKRMSFTAKYSFYMKDKLESSLNQGGGLLGSAAPLQELIVGHGIDISYRWKIISDLSIYVNYGMFVPADAYFENEPLRHFTMAGLVMSF